VYKFKRLIQGTWPSLATIAGLAILRSIGALQTLECMAFDEMMRLRPREAIDTRVVIIGIQESDLAELKTYPISDAVLAQTIQTLNSLNPAAIGVDIFRSFAVPPGQKQFRQVLEQTPNLFMVSRYTPDAQGDRIRSLAQPEQQGFVDVPLDPDGNLRRIILGFEAPQGESQISLSIQLASGLLADKDFQATETGLRLGQRDYPFITPQFGAYQRLDPGGDQIMLNPRNHPKPFRQFSLQQVQQGKLTAQDIQGKVVLVGLTAVSVKDTVNAMAILPRSSAQINGVEVQAHAVSQLLSAAFDGRPLIQSWPEAAEVLWIVACGVLGILLGRLSRSPRYTFLGIVLGLVWIFCLSYVLLSIGWWIPLVPAALAFFANASGFVAAQFYQQEQDLRLRLRDRQQMLEQTFMAVHNGPLQDLAGLSRSIQDAGVENGEIVRGLQKINQELRGIFEATQETLISDRPELYLGVGSRLNLQAPLHELLEQVYNETCARELAGVGMIQIKIVQFLPMDCGALAVEQKQALCRFLEEALRNVGKHAGSATKLWVNCGCEGNQRVICVKDNGDRIAGVVRSGAGTKQAKRLAKRLRGRFQRLPNQPQGMICRLVW
jgi:CHASE2 domain-containing sensor protein/two-component sensor histidine kinase